MSDSCLVVYPVRDVEQAKKLFRTLLGVEPYADAPYYVGFKVGDHETGLNPYGHQQGLTGPVRYYDVADIAATLAELLAAGADSVQDATDVGGGLLVAMVRDPDGNPIGLRQAPSTS